MQKICSVCENSKSVTEFGKDKNSKDGLNGICKVCKSAKDKKYRESNVDKRRAANKVYYDANAEKMRQRARTWYIENTERARASRRSWHVANLEAVKEMHKKWNDANKEKMKKYMNEYIKTKYKENLNYRIKTILNKRIRDCIRKDKSTLEILACDIVSFKEWLQSQFDEHMSWENMGKYWVLDHVKPCASFNFDLPEQVEECFHWENIRPMEARANMSKGDKILVDVIENHMKIVENFKCKQAYQA